MATRFDICAQWVGNLEPIEGMTHVRHGRTGAADARTRHTGANSGAADTGRNTGKANAGIAAGAADAVGIARAPDTGINELTTRNEV
jgi:hypothetical protein